MTLHLCQASGLSVIDFRRYRHYTYEDGGRGPTTIDCWGLAREARHDMGYDWLPLFAECRHTDPRGFTRAYEQQAEKMQPGPPESAAIAAAFRGRICVHVGIVVDIDNRLFVLDIDAGRGAEFTPLPDFEARYGEVIYYRDKNLPEPVF